MMPTAAGNAVQLWRYPVSSLAGELLERATIRSNGMAGDRLGAFYERFTGEIMSPPNVSKWNFAPQISARTSRGGAVEISVDAATWRPLGDPGLDSELAAFCGTEIEFKAYGSAHEGCVAAQRYAWEPLHLVSLQALEALRAQLPESLIDVRRFRPNIVVDLPGLPGPVPENGLAAREFTIGGVRLRGIRPARRCAFTTLAQGDLPEDPAILRELVRDFGRTFGIYCEVLEAGDIALGSELRIPAGDPVGVPS